MRFDPTVIRIANDKLRTKYPQALGSIVKATLMEVSHNIVRDTPVDTGNLRGQWQPSIGPAPSIKTTARIDPSGASAQADVLVQVEAFRLGDMFWMTNAAAYARRLEYGFTGTDSLGRNYDQRGRFFVRDNVKRFGAIFRQKSRQFGQSL